MTARPLILDDIAAYRRAATEPWGRPIAEAIRAEAASFTFLEGADLEDWPTADRVPHWAWDSRSDEIERIGHNRDAFIVAMGSVRRSQRIRRELFTMAAAAALWPEDTRLREACLRTWRAPLAFARWQYPGWTLYYKEHSMPADGDGEWGATENYLVTLPLCAEFLAQWLDEADWRRLRRRVAEFCSRIEDDFFVGRSWFFGGTAGGAPAGNQFTQVVAGWGVGAVSLLGHDPRAERWVEIVATQMLRSMDATGSDGSYFEGAAYGLGTMEQVWMLAHLLDRRGDGRLLEHPQVRNFPYWLMDTFLLDRDQWLPLNDAGGSLRAEALYNRRRNWAGAVMSLAARRFRDPALAWCLEEVIGGPSSDVFGLVYHDPEVPRQIPSARDRAIRMKPTAQWLAAAPPDVPHGDEHSAAGDDRRVVHYPMQGIVIARTGFGQDDVLFVLKGGWGAPGHDHNDRNSVLLYDGIVPVITEAGPGPYSDPEFDLHFGSHHAHSTLQIDGRVVAHGKAAKGVEGIERLPSGDFRAIGEAAPSYPELSRFGRVVTLELPDRLQIDDEVVPSDGKAHTAAFWFHSQAAAALEASGAVRIPGNRGSSWRLTATGASARFVREDLGGEGAQTRSAFVLRAPVPPEGAKWRFVVERINAGV